MKKIILLLAIIASFSFSVFAEEDNAEEGQSSLSYVNIPILKVLESRDAYLVIYQKNKIGVGSTVIPKAWARGTPDNPRKLKLRKAQGGINGSFMTVIKKDGDFFRVVLTLPLSKQNSVWGVVDYSKKLEGIDKETLEELAL